jgi:hypothetical protein
LLDESDSRARYGFELSRIDGKLASAEKVIAAHYFLPRCRAVVDHEYDKLFDIGICSGAMVAIHETSLLLNTPLSSSLRACMPDGVTVEQSIAVVVHWLDRHPQSLHENFTRLAMSAMREAWPCDE